MQLSRSSQHVDYWFGFDLEPNDLAQFCLHTGRNFDPLKPQEQEATKQSPLKRYLFPAAIVSISFLRDEIRAFESISANPGIASASKSLR